MKKLFIVFILGLVIQTKAQNYTFSKTTGTYADLTGSTVLANGNWDIFTYGIKMPFTFKYWGTDIVMGDSIYVDDYGTVSIDYDLDGEITFLYEELHSRGMDQSPMSYAVEGSTPNRILKIEYRNVGFDLDTTNADFANVQCWLYETSGIIEFRYGPNQVKTSSWYDDGAFVGITNSTFDKFIILENNPANPTVNTTDPFNATSLVGMPSNGTIYKFTPTGGTGIAKTEVKVNVSGNGIYLSESTEVTSVKIYNISGQLVQSAGGTDDIDLSLLNPGLYVVMIETNEGLISQKLVL